MKTKKPLAWSILFAIALIPAYPAAAAPNTMDALALGDGDVTHTLGAFGESTRFVFVDDDTDGIFDSSEAVYLQRISGPGRVGGLDVRVANPGSFSLGSQVRGSDGDFGNTVDATFPRALTPADLAYFDADGDAVFSTGDALLLDVDGSNTVTVNDIVLSGSDAGTVVTSSHSLLNNALLRHGPGDTRVGVFDADGDGYYTLGDVVHFDAAGAGLVTVADVVLSGSDFGTVRGPADAETTYVLSTMGTGGAGRFVFVDDDTDGIFDSNEAVYLQPGSGTGRVGGLDVRIANPGSFSLGSQVRGSDGDFGNTVDATFPRALTTADLAYFDADGDAAFSPGDTMFLDVNDSDTVAVNDIILSGSDAGTLVTSSHSLLNNALLRHGLPSGDTLVGVFDADGDGVYTLGDQVFFDLRVPGLATVQDLRASGSGFGHALADVDAETVYALGAYGVAPSAWNLVYVDGDGDGAFDSDEAVYLKWSSGSSVYGLDLRIANPASTLGSQVCGGDADFGIGALPYPGAPTLADFDYADMNGDAAFDTGDVLVVDADGSGTASADDIVLSGDDAGTVVTEGHALHGTVLWGGSGAYPSGFPTLLVFDGDGDGTYSLGDRVYLETNGHGLATVQDVRLGLGGSCSPPCGPNDGDCGDPEPLVDPDALLPDTCQTPDATVFGAVGAFVGSVMDAVLGLFGR